MLTVACIHFSGAYSAGLIDKKQMHDTARYVLRRQALVNRAQHLPYCFIWHPNNLRIIALVFAGAYAADLVDEKQVHDIVNTHI